MKASQTRKKLFIMCIIFMGFFMVVSILALQTLEENAYFEANAEAEISEMQQLYDVYYDLSNYYEESLSLITSVEHIEQSVISALENDNASENEYIQKLSNQFADYTEFIDIYIIDSEKIMCLHKSAEEDRIKRHKEGGDIDFIVGREVLEFLNKYDLYEEEELYNSNHVIIETLDINDDIYVIGIPRYDKAFSFADNQMVIYDKFDIELLRLNTEPLEYNKSVYSLTGNQNYKSLGIGSNRLILCYYSNEDEYGDYCLGTISDFDFSFRYYIYMFLLLFFVLTGIGMWIWSEKITKPLDFFIMWIRLIKKKGTIGEDEIADKPLAKENHMLQNSIMTYFSFCIIPIILAGAIQWYAENQILNSYVEERYVESAEFYGNILDQKFYIWRSPIDLLCNDDMVRSALEKHSDDEELNFDIDLMKYLNSYTKNMPDDSDRATIYNTAGIAIASAIYDFEEDRYIRYRMNVGDDYKWSFAERLGRFALHQKIYNDAEEIIGYCKLELNEPDLRYNASCSSDNMYSCYIYKYADKIFNLIGSPELDDEKVINMIRGDEGTHLSESIELKNAGINYFYVVNEKVFFERVWNEYVVAFMNIVFFVVISIFFAASIMTRVTLNPIIQLSNALYNDSPQIPMSTLLLGKEEFALLVNRVRTLTEQVDTYAKEQKLLEEERQEHEKRRKDAEMLTLQTQINPHFMYNIFSSIAVLIRTGQSEKAANMVMHTGNLMRLGLYRGHVMIPLKEEIEHVNQYIKIQQIRYNNCMEIKFDVDENIMQYKVVKFILQPIIENAIEHNVGYLEGKMLEIIIKAFKKEESLIIEIVDNGRGLEKDKMGSLQDSINNFDMSNHLGLANINERIKLNCGEEYGVILDKNDGDGLKVELKLPIVVNKEEQQDV